jgi:glycosyltransferase involved in cell wall biosynthesis
MNEFMRILLINNFFHGVGGVERVFFLERELLRQHGHTVIDFSTRDPQNEPSEYAEFFVRSVDFHAPGNIIEKAARFFWSPEVDQALSALIEKTKPDVAHVHGCFDVLGPTVLRVLARHGVRIVFTAHAYKLVCPNWKLFAHGHVHELCGASPLFALNDVVDRTIQNSFLKSAWGVAGWMAHRAAGTFAKIDCVISPSQFLIEKHLARGWAAKKFVHIPNPVAVNEFEKAPAEGNYFLFVGRLVEEKGVAVLLRAAARLPQVQFQIIGDGPCSETLRVGAPPNVAFLGRKNPEDVAEYMRGALGVVVPSVWYENDSLSVLEAQAMGKIVVASHIGGIPEQIIHGETGFLCEPGNDALLAEALEQIIAAGPAARARIGAHARAVVHMVRDPELYYEQLMGVLGCV